MLPHLLMSEVVMSGRLRRKTEDAPELAKAALAANFLTRSELAFVLILSGHGHLCAASKSFS